MLRRLKENLYHICNVLELLTAVVVIIGILIAGIGLGGELTSFWAVKGEQGAFFDFLEAIFEIVIGIEFLKMLCQPNVDTVLEVLIFLVSRHMIIGKTSAYEDLISIISIAILFGIKKYIQIPTKKGKMSTIFESGDETKEEGSDENER